MPQRKLTTPSGFASFNLSVIINTVYWRKRIHGSTGNSQINGFYDNVFLSLVTISVPIVITIRLFEKASNHHCFRVNEWQGLCTASFDMSLNTCHHAWP